MKLLLLGGTHFLGRHLVDAAFARGHVVTVGDRPPRAVVPAPPERPIQLIDARDLAAFMLDLVERDMGGTFNACSPAGQWTIGDLVAAACRAAPSPPEPVALSTQGERAILASMGG